MTDNISKAPPPIAPIRGLSLTPVKPIDWSYWKLMTGVQLWEAVSLSVGISPDIRPKAGEKFDKRLRIAESHAATKKLPIITEHLNPAQSTVTLAQFAAWGLSVGIDMPPELVAMATGTQPAPAKKTLTPAVLMAGASDGAEQGLTTSEIAYAFDNVSGWPAARWIKNLSAAKWARPALIGLGEQGGAPSVWRPLMLAQLVHARAGAEKETTLKKLAKRFSRQDTLAPWREAFKEFSATFSDAD